MHHQRPEANPFIRLTGRLPPETLGITGLGWFRDVLPIDAPWALFTSDTKRMAKNVPIAFAASLRSPQVPHDGT